MPGPNRCRTSSITAWGACSISSAWRPTWCGAGASRRTRAAKRVRGLSEAGARVARAAGPQDGGEVGALRRLDRRVPQLQIGLQVGANGRGGRVRVGLALAARRLSHGVLHDVLAL